jgi:hypothetical protein
LSLKSIVFDIINALFTRNNLLVLTVLTLILADGKCYVLLFLEHGILLEIFYFNQPMKKVFHLPHPSKQKQNGGCRCRRKAVASLRLKRNGNSRKASVTGEFQSQVSVT